MKSKIDTIQAAYDYLSYGTIEDKVQLADPLAKYKRGLTGMLDLMVVVEALVKEYNSDKKPSDIWEADYDNGNQKKWFPWMEKRSSGRSSGFVFSGSDYAYGITYTSMGARLALPTAELSEWLGTQFEELLNTILLHDPKAFDGLMGKETIADIDGKKYKVQIIEEVK